MGRGEKAKRLSPLSPFPSHHSLLALYARSHLSSLALLACLACSRVPQSPLSLRETCGGGSRLGNVSFRDWSIDSEVPAVSGCSPE